MLFVWIILAWLGSLALIVAMRVNATRSRAGRRRAAKRSRRSERAVGLRGRPHTSA